MTLVQRFAKNETGRDLIVGDIHGNFTKLQTRLADLGFNPDAGDRLFSVGDLVDRGPESHLSLNWLAQPWFHAVAGNHEAMAIDWDAGTADLQLYAMNGGAWNIGNDEAARRDFALAFAAMPIAIELETEAGTVGIVHADCPYSSWPDFVAALENPDAEDMERMHLVAMAQWLRTRVENGDTSPVTGVRAVVVGHTPIERCMTLGNVIYIDTGGWLGREFCILDAATLLQQGVPA
jgi:serine/threonine protein phosphatase 1